MNETVSLATWFMILLIVIMLVVIVVLIILSIYFNKSDKIEYASWHLIPNSGSPSSVPGIFPFSSLHPSQFAPFIWWPSINDPSSWELLSHAGTNVLDGFHSINQFYALKSGLYDISFSMNFAMQGNGTLEGNRSDSLTSFIVEYNGSLHSMALASGSSFLESITGTKVSNILFAYPFQIHTSPLGSPYFMITCNFDQKVALNAGDYLEFYLLGPITSLNNPFAYWDPSIAPIESSQFTITKLKP